MKARRFLYGANSLIFILIVLAILVVLNYIAFKRAVRLDVTQKGLYSLSDQTIKVLKNMDKGIEILAFFKEIGSDRTEFQDLMSRYKTYSDKIKVRFVDPDKEPGITAKYDVTEYGTVVLANGDQNIKVRLTDLVSGNLVNNAEEEITNAIIKLSRGTRKTVYFLTTHGERDIKDDSEAEGFGSLRRALEGESYMVEELVLLRKGSVPTGNSILIVAGPKKPLLEKEVQAVKKYLEGGGKAVFMVEPKSAKELVSLIKDYGFDMGNNVIIDPSSKLVGGGDIAPIVAEYPYHLITEGFNLATLFPYSRSVEAKEDDEFTVTVIAKTDQYSWAEDDFALFDQGIAEKNEDDKSGPLGVVAVGEGDESRIAVFGSVDFISNRFFDFSGNRDFFLNTINWVAGDEHLISIRPRVAEEGKLTLTVNRMRLIFSLTVIVLPAIILISGVTVWWRRRNM
ncbi:MAG TPA: GldG family protein [Thermodesulfobacteriota bacterium]|nr:GldG family protein [Thermodesulfobacteriota bacterium]